MQKIKIVEYHFYVLTFAYFVTSNKGLPFNVIFGYLICLFRILYHIAVSLGLVVINGRPKFNGSWA